MNSFFRLVLSNNRNIATCQNMEGFISRAVKEHVFSREQSEGVGARVRRSIGTYRSNGTSVRLDPFLMLDEFMMSGDEGGGFPDHPHRGFETVTYMLEGKFFHEDFMGNKGTIGTGDLQWMTAGKGIVHSEMPDTTERVNRGLQLWINLAPEDKFCDPAYQELPRDKVPKVDNGNGVEAIVIAGDALGTTSPVYTRTPAHYIHYFMQPGSVVDHIIPEGFNSFIYTLEGNIHIGNNEELCEPHFTVILTQEGQGVRIKCGDQPANFVLLAARPIGAPVVQQGPFVLNTEEELRQAFSDYRNGRNGFESAPNWYSQIGLPITHADRKRMF